MEQNQEMIWAYYSVHRQNLDNDYIFYKDGTILHHYDRTMSKWDIEESVCPSDIPEADKEKIISKCESKCKQEIVNHLKSMLNVK